MKTILYTFLCSVALALGVSHVSALPITLGIDFRTWTGAGGLTVFSKDGVTTTAGAHEGTSFLLSQSPVNGLGVDSAVVIPPPSSENPDEVGPQEILDLVFDPLNSGKGITGVWITQLFPPTGVPAEKGTVSLVHSTGTASLAFSGLNANGELFLSFGALPLNLISATFEGEKGLRIFNPDFSIAGFERQAASTPTPEAGTSLLFLITALAGLGILQPWFRHAA